MTENSGNATKYSLLQPFIHQVGGRNSFLCLDEATICKPFNDQEKLFYETMPESLKSFVPSYYGITNVQLNVDGHYLSFSATTPTSYKPKSSRNLKNLRVRHSGSVELDGGVEFDECDVTTSLNPWALKIHKEAISKLTSRMEELPLKFIALENLTWRFKLPCIMDVKMGTKHYKDDDSWEKKQRRIERAINTTSAKLGVRMTGMQVYKSSSGKFLCHNKNYGRTLSPEGFQNVLHNFFHDGSRLRVDVLPPLIRRLEELHCVMSQLETLRLYRTSLLLLYEGCRVIKEVEVLGEEPLTDVRIIDFATTIHSAMNDKVLESGPDSGFLLGLDTMIRLLKSILADSTQHSSVDS